MIRLPQGSVFITRMFSHDRSFESLELTGGNINNVRITGKSDSYSEGSQKPSQFLTSTTTVLPYGMAHAPFSGFATLDRFILGG
jgi:hypothetical protein